MKLIPKANGMAFAPHLIMTATISTEIAARLKEIARLLDEQEANQLLQFSGRRRMMIWPINQYKTTESSVTLKQWLSWE